KKPGSKIGTGTDGFAHEFLSLGHGAKTGADGSRMGAVALAWMCQSTGRGLQQLAEARKIAFETDPESGARRLHGDSWVSRPSDGDDGIDFHDGPKSATRR